MKNVPKWLFVSQAGPRLLRFGTISSRACYNSGIPNRPGGPGLTECIPMASFPFFMPEFVCRLGTPSGEIVTRIVEAHAAGEARRTRSRIPRFDVSSAEGGIRSLFAMGGSGAKRKVKQSDFLLFNQQLSALLRAGIPVLQAISLLKTRSPSASLRAVLGNVEEKIKNGVPLSQAFESQGIFPRIYTASILAGEQSGSLDEVLHRFVEYLRRSVSITRKLRGALAYPAFLLVAAGFMIAFLTLYIVPRMSDLFRGLDANRGLPAITNFVLAVSTGLTKTLVDIAAYIIVLIVSLVVWLRTATAGWFCINCFARSPAH